MNKFLIGLIVTLAALGCEAAARPDSSALPRKVQVWVDQSNSICPAQRAKWFGYVQLILQKLKPNDLVEIFDISDVTEGAAPLFTRAMPRLPESPTKSDEEVYQQELGTFQIELEKALDQAFGSGGREVRSTDIFSLFPVPAAAVP